MKIDVAEAVRSEGETFTAVFDGPLQEIDFSGDSFSFPEAHVEARYRFDGEGVAVEGSFSAVTEARCSRCLKKFGYPVDFEFCEYYAKQPEPDDGFYQYTSEIIDLTRMLQDNVILNLPIRFLCAEGCKGLCASCGADLNAGACGCGGTEKGI